MTGLPSLLTLNGNNATIKPQGFSLGLLYLWEYNMKLSQARSIVKSTIDHNLNNDGGSNSSYLCPMLWSLPGEGKSTVISDLLKEMGLQEQQLIAAQYDAGELGGFPMIDHESKTYIRARPFFMPTSGKGAVVCDELPQAPTAVQNVIAQLVNERRIGEHKLPEGWTVICAGNPMAAKAGTNGMPSHLKDRLLHLEIETDHEGFRDYALAKGFRPEVTTYIHERPEWLQKFDPKQNASPSPRSWERANTILGLGLDGAEEMFALQGQLGEGAVADFVGYLRVWKDMPRFEDIMDNPKGHSIPSNPAILYALCSNLAHKANKSNISKVLDFVDRFENKEFTAFCVKDTIQRTPDLKAEKSVQNWLFSTGKDLLL